MILRKIWLSPKARLVTLKAVLIRYSATPTTRDAEGSETTVSTAVRKLYSYRITISAGTHEIKTGSSAVRLTIGIPAPYNTI